MERFGRYVLLERIAHGGMAEVFRAAQLGQEGFARQVAVKRILPHLAQEAEFVGMLVDEARIAATLHHPNILPVLDLGREGSVYFIAMEFVSGQALNNVVAQALRARERLPHALCVHVVSQALRGLAFAHEKTDATGRPMGIIHRDVSPQNIMVGYDGAVWLADFGIAKAAERSTQTLTGSLKGKPAYMSPEQVTRHQVDQRVDLYAMGVVLHELLAMRRMRKAQSDVQVLVDVAGGQYPRLNELGVELPDVVADALYRALEPDPDRRWQTARAFADALEAAADGCGWNCTTTQAGQQMQRLFPLEMARERDVQARFQGLMEEMARAAPDQISAIIRRESADEPTAAGSPAGGNPPTPRPGAAAALPPGVTPLSATRVVAFSALLGVLVAAAGVVGWWFTVGSRQAPGQLIVETAPPGASVTVAGRPIPGTAPVVAPSLAPGPVEIVVMLPGWQLRKEVVVIRPGATEKVRLVLDPVEVRVPVSTTPPGARVVVDGRAVGATPMTVVLRGGAPRDLKLELDGFLPWQRAVQADEAPPRIDAVLERVPSASPPPAEPARAAQPPARKNDKTPARAEGDGFLSLQSRPWGRILVDGKDTGRFTPVADLPIPAGRHTVKLINDEENLGTAFLVTVKPGETVSLFKELR
ncbi:MAG: protein kinase [Deltaproteobacteria bacterium]|nr:protein kinase [Deltaproteobacteria bacterium]